MTQAHERFIEGMTLYREGAEMPTDKYGRRGWNCARLIAIDNGGEREVTPQPVKPADAKVSEEVYHIAHTYSSSRPPRRTKLIYEEDGNVLSA